MSDRKPEIIEKDNYWLVCLPMDVDEPLYVGIIWHKHQFTPLTMIIPMTLSELEVEAAKTVEQQKAGDDT